MGQPQLRVLVVTAMHSIYTLIQRTLKAHGFHTTCAISYDEAEIYLKDGSYKLIILELDHTKQQCIDDYYRFRQNAAIPLIVLIDGSMEKNNITITDIVIDNYVYYPFAPEDLIIHIRNVLHPHPDQLILHLGPVTIHLDEHQAVCNSQKIHLTRTEWKLMEIFALHIGKTLPHRTLLQHVWGDAYHSEYNYLHTYISQLRRKLEPDPTKPLYLLTEVGTGYRLEAQTNGVQHLHQTPTYSIVGKTAEIVPPLTIPTTKLFGREDDIQAVQNLLSQPDVRLLTLTGPPGVGKTRLAQHVAETIQHQFTDGHYTVSLAPLHDCSLVMSEIAKAVGAKENVDQTLYDALIQTFKNEQALLILDNFEHVLEAASLITELINAAPYLTILATSRKALNITCEQEYTVFPLAIPDLTTNSSPETLARNPAVALFLRRSQSVKPNFTLTPENAMTVATICARLDGLPLALELAAARSKLFPPKSLLARLDQRFTLLSLNNTDAPERHQTLRAALDWSYQLLQSEDQCIFAGLSVFINGCTLEDAASVLSKNQQILSDTLLPAKWLSHKLQPSTLINHITTLVDHSLVQVIQDANGEPHFLLLETIREYAWEKLVENYGMEVETLRKLYIA